MIQLLDVNPVSKGVATIFADTKTEVPETAAALFAALEPNEWTKKLNPGLAAGTMIITSTFDVAFVRSDGLIQWKGEEPPVPPVPPEPGETVSFSVRNYSGQFGTDSYTITYTDAYGEGQTQEYDENTFGDCTLDVLKDSDLTVTGDNYVYFVCDPDTVTQTTGSNYITITMSEDVVFDCIS